MARPLRIEFPGALYHVTARGNARQDLFLDDEDRQQFLTVLAPGLQDKRLLKEIPRRQRFAARPTLSQLFGARTRADRVWRNESIRRAQLDHGYSLTENRSCRGLALCDDQPHREYPRRCLAHTARSDFRLLYI
jgi:hypothetical protein